MSGIFVCLLFALAVQQISATRHLTYLQDETQQTLETLQTLPSHCTTDLDTLILAKQRKLPGKVFYCSISSIVIDLAEVLVDTFFFGFEAYEEVPAFIEDLKALKGCLSLSSVEEKVACAVEYLPGTVQAVEVIVGGMENYVGEMEMIVPLLVQEIQQCKDRSFSQYKDFLESALVQATTCSQ